MKIVGFWGFGDKMLPNIGVTLKSEEKNLQGKQLMKNVFQTVRHPLITEKSTILREKDGTRATSTVNGKKTIPAQSMSLSRGTSFKVIT